MRYIFRGLVILEYHPLTKELTAPAVDGFANINMCKFITEDYELLAQYFNTIHMHSLGNDVKLEDIEVY